jgi:hypothetical protein
MDGVHVVCLLVSMLERVVRVGGRWWSIVVDGEDTEVTVIAAFTRMSFSSILDPGLCRGKTAHGGGYGSRSPRDKDTRHVISASRYKRYAKTELLSIFRLITGHKAIPEELVTFPCGRR